MHQPCTPKVESVAWIPRARTRFGKRIISHGRGRHEEISVITPDRHLSVTDYDTYLKVPVTINGRRTVAMIDLGATGSFIIESLIRL